MMGEKYRFYVQMDGEEFGPYTAQEVRDLDLLNDVLVTEDSMNGQWLPASQFDFDDMANREKGEVLQPNQSFIVRDDGTVSLSNSANSTTTDYDPNNVPDEIKQWNWGAFIFGWIWAVFNGVYWPILIGFIPYVGGLIMSIVLGMNGNEMAWKNKRWDSLEHFKRVQHNWAMACLWYLGILAIIIFIIALSSN